MDFKELANKHNTPLYVYDFNHIENSFNRLKDAFRARKSLIAYAIKANSNLSIIKFLASLGAGADCVSKGEIQKALLAGVQSYKIIFSGVGKCDDEIAFALKEDILLINVESEPELYRVETIAKEMGKVARISIRVNPNIDPKTHPYISTGLSENKFGVDIELAKKLYIHAKNSEFLDPIGVHFHIGSQLTDLEPIREASKKIADFTRNLLALKIELKFFDIGGGVGIRYRDEDVIKPYDYAQAVLETLSGIDVTVVCEPGRFLVGNSGYFVTKVLFEKATEKKRFVVVDGGMNDLLRPSLYNAYHEVFIPGKMGKCTIADIVGPVCESGDFLAKDVLIPETEHNDLVVVKSSGAYGFTMASNYNSRLKSAEVGCYNGECMLIRERESFEYLVEQERKFLEENRWKKS